jgi:uncharacterized protein
MMTSPATLLRRGKPFTFIDLARLGQIGWWTAVKAFIRIAGWVFLATFALGFAGGLVSALRHVSTPDGPLWEFGILATTTFGLLMGVRSAVRKSQRRPFMSLFGLQSRPSLRRIALGAVLWFATKAMLLVLVLLPAALFEPAILGNLVTKIRWHPNTELLTAALLSIAIMPIQAASEELVFRGWLTQTLGQAIRRLWLLMLIVGLIFALAHGFRHGWWATPYYLLMSIGFSWLSLWDGRLELAIGAHAANNIYAVAATLFSFGGSGTTSPGTGHPNLIYGSQAMNWQLLLGLALQMAIAYAVIHRYARRSFAGAPAPQSAEPDLTVADDEIANSSARSESTTSELVGIGLMAQSAELGPPHQNEGE